MECVDLERIHRRPIDGDQTDVVAILRYNCHELSLGWRAFPSARTLAVQYRDDRLKAGPAEGSISQLLSSSASHPSVPSPPSASSVPGPPTRVSSPPRPSMRSARLPPKISLGPSSPIRTSLYADPLRFSTLSSVSWPQSPASAVPAPRSAVTGRRESKKRAVSTPAPPSMMSTPPLPTIRLSPSSP